MQDATFADTVTATESSVGFASGALEMGRLVRRSSSSKLGGDPNALASKGGIRTIPRISTWNESCVRAPISELDMMLILENIIGKLPKVTVELH